ncbi:MAG TPA: chalcone isomerase family protein [Ramlibacter sp.]|nr:chalcone isomerase family protein [Ramlibacter sp.]
MFLLRSAALAFALAMGSAIAQPVVTNGVKFEEAVELRGTRLQLNGAGTRYRGPFKVYAAGFYLTKKAGTPEEVLAAPGPKRISVTMLREIDSSELGKLFARSMEDNMDKAAFSKLIPGVMRMSQVFTDNKKMAAGEQFTIDWVPGTGAILTVKGQVQGEPFREPEFFNALLRIWVGPKPADAGLKDALLGKAAAASNPGQPAN